MADPTAFHVKQMMVEIAGVKVSPTRWFVRSVERRFVNTLGSRGEMDLQEEENI